MTDNDVRPLQHRPTVPRAPDVLPGLPMVRCQADSALGHLGDRGDGLPRPQKGGPGRLDGSRALGDTVALIGAWSASFGPCAVRAPDRDETPLSPDEEAIAMKVFLTRSVYEITHPSNDHHSPQRRVDPVDFFA
jgi:hypothetical protein